MIQYAFRILALRNSKLVAQTYVFIPRQTVIPAMLLVTSGPRGVTTPFCIAWTDRKSGRVDTRGLNCNYPPRGESQFGLASGAM